MRDADCQELTDFGTYGQPGSTPTYGARSPMPRAPSWSNWRTSW